jgi:hypothetical protein
VKEQRPKQNQIPRAATKIFREKPELRIKQKQSLKQAHGFF